jgi:hypothetical protein
VEDDDEFGCVLLEDDEPEVPREPDTLALPDPLSVAEELSLCVPLRIDELEPVEVDGRLLVELPELSELLEVEDDDEGEVVDRVLEVEEPLGLALLPVDGRSCEEVWAWRPRAAAKNAAVPQVINLAGVFMRALAY